MNLPSCSIGLASGCCAGGYAGSMPHTSIRAVKARRHRQLPLRGDHNQRRDGPAVPAHAHVRQGLLVHAQLSSFALCLSLSFAHTLLGGGVVRAAEHRQQRGPRPCVVQQLRRLCTAVARRHRQRRSLAGHAALQHGHGRPARLGRALGDLSARDASGSRTSSLSQDAMLNSTLVTAPAST